MRGATESPVCAGSSNDWRNQILSPLPIVINLLGLLLWLYVYAIIDIIGVRGLRHPFRQ
jgi:hypothetical protein